MFLDDVSSSAEPETSLGKLESGRIKSGIHAL